MAISEKQIGVRFSRKAYAVLERVAKDNECGPSTLIRRLVMERLGIEEKLILPQVPSHDGSPRLNR